MDLRLTMTLLTRRDQLRKASIQYKLCGESEQVKKEIFLKTGRSAIHVNLIQTNYFKNDLFLKCNNFNT